MQVRRTKKLNEARTKGSSASNVNSTLTQEVQKQVDATAQTTVETDGNSTTVKSDIEEALDMALSVAKREKASIARHQRLHPEDSPRKGNYTNVLLIGTAGSGKTSITEKWAHDNGCNLYVVTASTLDPTDLTGVTARGRDGKSTVKLGTRMFDPLNRENSILFLDEFNRAGDDVRGTLLTLVNDHQIDTGTEEDTAASGMGGKKELPNFLFTVVAVNPANGNYNTNELDPAELSRLMRVHVASDKQSTWQYYHKFFSQDMEDIKADVEADLMDVDEATKEVNAIEGRMGIAEALMNDPTIQFDNDEDERTGKQTLNQEYTPLNKRSLLNCLVACDGTKGDFLRLYERYCNRGKLTKIKAVLAKYQDKDVKANSPFKKRATKMSLFDQVSNFVGEGA